MEALRGARLLVGTATVTTQGLLRRLRHDAKGGDFYLATIGDFLTATDTARPKGARLPFAIVRSERET